MFYSAYLSNAETKELKNKPFCYVNLWANLQSCQLFQENFPCKKKKRNDHSQSVWNFSLLELFTETACSGYELCMLLKLSLPTAQKLDHSEATVAAFAPPWRKLHVLWSIEVVDGLHMGSLHTYMLKWLKQHFMPHLTLIQQFNLLLYNWLHIGTGVMKKNYTRNLSKNI